MNYTWEAKNGIRVVVYNDISRTYFRGAMIFTKSEMYLVPYYKRKLKALDKLQLELEWNADKIQLHNTIRDLIVRKSFRNRPPITFK